jgi:hypothetical protein
MIWQERSTGKCRVMLGQTRRTFQKRSGERSWTENGAELEKQFDSIRMA